MFALWNACYKAKLIPATKSGPERTWYEIQTGLMSAALRDPTFARDSRLRVVQSMRLIQYALNAPGGPAKVLADMERD